MQTRTRDRQRVTETDADKNNRQTVTKTDADKNNRQTDSD